eukprot:6708020-Prymnesium_polylepis.3
MSRVWGPGSLLSPSDKSGSGRYCKKKQPNQFCERMWHVDRASEGMTTLKQLQAECARALID